MIPNEIKRKHVLLAMEFIDDQGVPKKREATKYHVLHDGKHYPAKYVISLACERATSVALLPSEFNGGEMSNRFLRHLGFDVVPVVKSEKNTAIAIKPSLKKLDLNVVTATIECIDYLEFVTKKHRIKLLKKVLREVTDADVILFPAGYFNFYLFDENYIYKLGEEISKIVNELVPETVVCFGLDCDDGVDQLALAVNFEGVLAIGRKFHPTDSENGVIDIAESYNTTELDYNRTFTHKGVTFYMAVCYDCFGIKHNNEENPDVDVILGLVHYFTPPRTTGSGEVNFVRKGFAGASQHWQCPIFGTAVFIDRKIPPNFPTGLLWLEQGKSVMKFGYADNLLKPLSKVFLEEEFESACCTTYFI